jgi:hypothetical protein
LYCFAPASGPSHLLNKTGDSVPALELDGKKRGRGGPARPAKSIKRSLKVIEQRGEEESDGVLWLLLFDGPLVAAH